MNAVCGSCGYPNGTRVCSFCPLHVCDRCRAYHESACVQIQARKRRGEGPTVRHVIPQAAIDPAPAPAPEPTMADGVDDDDGSSTAVAEEITAMGSVTVSDGQTEPSEKSEA